MPKIFDFHVHFPQGFGPMGQNTDLTPQERVDHLAMRLREAGVAKACLLSGRRAQATFGVTHEEALTCMEPYQDLFIPVAVIDPGQHSPERIHELHDMGYRGLKIIGTEKDYDADEYLPVYAMAEKLNMPILFHMGVIGGGLDYAKATLGFPPPGIQLFSGVFLEAHAIARYTIPERHCAHTLTSLALVPHGILSAFANGFTLPLGHADHDVEDQAPGRRASIESVGHADQ